MRLLVQRSHGFYVVVLLESSTAFPLRTAAFVGNADALLRKDWQLRSELLSLFKLRLRVGGRNSRVSLNLDRRLKSDFTTQTKLYANRVLVILTIQFQLVISDSWGGRVSVVSDCPTKPTAYGP